MIDVSEVTMCKLDVEPGDVLLLSVPAFLTQAAADYLLARFKELLPGVQIVFIDERVMSAGVCVECEGSGEIWR